MDESDGQPALSDSSQNHNVLLIEEEQSGAFDLEMQMTEH